MKRTKMQKGITLVALIITIIVLLILAVVAIRAVQGGGIIAHAKNARDNSVEAQDKEAILLALNEWKIVSATGNQTFENFMKEKFGEDKVVTGDNENEVIVTLENGNQYKVKADGTIEATKGISISSTTLTLILASQETKTAELTATLSGIDGEINWSNSDDTKATLSSTTGEKITVTGLTVGETTITVSCGNYSKTCTVTVLEKLDHSEVVVPTVAKTGVYASSANIKEVRKGVKADIPIPNGFTYVKGDDIGGAVITDDDGNEFVWVPTTEDIVAYGLNTSSYREPDVITGVIPSPEVDSASGKTKDAILGNLTRAGCTEDLTGDGKVNAYDFKIQLTNEFNEMATSVNKYYGFYVGRYEMSIDEITQKAKSVGKVKSAIADIEERDWYGLYAKAKTYTNAANSVTSRMIYGSQYDAMMTWMSNNGIEISKATPIDTPSGNQTIQNRDKANRITGSEPKDKLNNIFDLLGNSCEWTQEAEGKPVLDGRVARGDSFQNAQGPNNRWASTNPEFTYSNSSDSTRISMYIN